MSALRKAPRVPAGPNSLAAACNRRALIGAALMAPIGVAACVADTVRANSSALAQLWETDRLTLQAIDDFPDLGDDADAHLWKQVSDAETAILQNAAVSPADVIAKLKVALLHSGAEDWVDAALIAGNDEALFAKADELDFTPRMIVSAIQSLAAMEF